MSSQSSEDSVASVTLKDIYHAVISPSSSSADPPMEEWSSLFDIETPESPKMVKYKQGLYDPGSAEICAKYLPMSDSNVLRHVYYNYPGIKDPGIMEALSKPEKRKVYDTNGQELYLDLCEEMNLVPVRSFHRGLIMQVIDLRFYGVNPIGVRAMCLALALNSTVQHLNLSSSFLSEDACYHLGQLLGENHCLRELVLTGCKIKPDGLRRLVIRLARRTMDLLDLSKNDLGDEGFEHLTAQILKGAVIKRLSLSNNNLGEVSAHTFVAAIEGNKTCTHLDLSWNKLYPPKGANDLLKQLGDSKVLTELYLSWNALTVGLHLRKLIAVPTLRLLDLSSNRLSSAAAKAICSRLHLAPALQTLDLSYNPLTPADALLLLQKLGEKEVALQNLLMDDVIVSKEFASTLKEVLSLNYRTQTKVTHGKVLRDYTLSVPDLREVVMRRLHFLTESTRKCTMDLPLFFLKEYKERETMMPRELTRALKVAGGPIDEGLIEELTRVFPGPKAEKGGNTIQLYKVVEFIRRLWPEKQLPPTPPPTPPVAPVKKVKGKKKKSSFPQ